MPPKESRSVHNSMNIIKIKLTTRNISLSGDKLPKYFIRNLTYHIDRIPKDLEKSTHIKRIAISKYITCYKWIKLKPSQKKQPTVILYTLHKYTHQWIQYQWIEIYFVRDRLTAVCASQISISGTTYQLFILPWHRYVCSEYIIINHILVFCHK